MKVIIQILTKDLNYKVTTTCSETKLKKFEKEILRVLAGEEDALLIVTDDGRTYIPSDVLKLSLIKIKTEIK